MMVTEPSMFWSPYCGTPLSLPKCITDTCCKCNQMVARDSPSRMMVGRSHPAMLL